MCVCVCVFDTRDEDDETPLGQVNLLDWIHFEIGPDQRVCARTLHLRLLTGAPICPYSLHIEEDLRLSV